MKEIKFRVWSISKSGNNGTMHYLKSEDSLQDLIEKERWKVMQFTGLKDKNGLHDLYEGDIIDIEGNLFGNIYEHKNVYKEPTYLIIQGFGTKNWCATYKEAMDRGCQNA